MTPNRRPAVDAATKKAVADASNPFGSAWVSANAGSGKTYVLSRRVVRLLLAGTAPGRILCLTFTKAAAAEMAKRVFATLAEWTTLSDEALAKAITELGERSPDTARLAVARRLFASALETPGGLKIQTIHAFCERLLHQFPFEANVAGHFEILEERDTAALKIDARHRVLTRAAEHPDGALGRALACVLSHASDMTYEEALADFVGDRDRLVAWISHAGGTGPALAGLRKALGLGEADTREHLLESIVSASLFDDAAVGRLHALLCESGKSTDTRAAARLAPYLEASSVAAKTDAWLDLMTTASGDLRKPGSLVTKAVKHGWPGLDERIEAEIDRLGVLLERLKAAECLATTAAMVHLAEATIGEYETLKAARGVLDFEDLIMRTANLLAQSGATEWVQYKLDRGLDHILVDEAQDTSPRQWQVIKALTEDFFSGMGASDATRTLFAVGDEKQSIFSFQGAVPAWFSRVRRELGTKARAASYDFEDVELHLSFRSTQIVLSAVDTVFDLDRARAGVTTGPEWPYHTAARRDDPGRVLVWPLIDPPQRPEPEDWTAPLDHLDAKSPEIALAERIATTIGAWLENGEILEGTGLPIRPGDILILTRNRGIQTEAINRALKTAGVPIAGADRLRISEHIAIMDLVALGRVMLLPGDDLSLAAVLKSPLIGLSEDALYQVAEGRGGSLWDALGSAEGAVFREAFARLENWRAEADWRDPYAFFARILGPDRGRQAIMRRLGAEAEDVLDEFLNQALAFERTQTPSLQGFLAWIEGSATDIKRDTDMLRDEVRVMTVHGAKGLEAGIVFLVDTGSAPVHAGHDPRIVALGGNADETVPAPLVWMRGRRAMPEAVTDCLENLRLRAADEYRRLLYVAMTRARDRLYVCGTRKRNGDAELGWHALVRDALEPESHRVEDPEGDLVALEWRAELAEPAKYDGAKKTVEEEAPLPDWAGSDAAPPPPVATRLLPSAVLRLDDDSGADAEPPLVEGPGDGSANGALLRGRAIHSLLQALPDHPAGVRRDVAARYLAAIAPELDGAVLVDEVMAVLDDTEFGALFGPDSRAEVEIAGRIHLGDGETMVSGRIDRLYVAADRILVVDYKTNRVAPDRLADVPRDYIAQLSLYRRILAGLYPNRKVSAALLWTGIPRFMEIPSQLLDEVESTMISAKSGGLRSSGG